MCKFCRTLSDDFVDHLGLDKSIGQSINIHSGVDMTDGDRGVQLSFGLSIGNGNTGLVHKLLDSLLAHKPGGLLSLNLGQDLLDAQTGVGLFDLCDELGQHWCLWSDCSHDVRLSTMKERSDGRERITHLL